MNEMNMLINKLNRNSAKKHIEETCGIGWLHLVDIIYDNKPKNVEITEVFQKWAGLKVNYKGENEHFEELTHAIYYISKKICEICGMSGSYAIVDGWETTLCNQHFEKSDAKEKYRLEYKK